ncbi:hypothetical protein CDAR_607151, partial [Caerostris darwini]
RCAAQVFLARDNLFGVLVSGEECKSIRPPQGEVKVKWKMYGAKACFAKRIKEGYVF